MSQTMYLSETCYRYRTIFVQVIMETAEKIKSYFRATENERNTLRKVTDEAEKVSLFPELLPGNYSKYLLATVQGIPEIEYKKEHSASNGTLELEHKFIYGPEKERKDSQKERKRKSRNKLVTRNGITKPRKRMGEGGRPFKIP